MSDEYKKMLERFEQICQNVKKELCAKKEKEQEKRFIEKIDKGLTISEYDEIEYWLANVEVLDNTDYILNNRKAKILVRYLKEKQQKIERLKRRLEEYQEYVEINHKEIKRLKKYEQECIDHYLVQCKYASEMEDKYITANNIINELEKDIKNLYTYGIKNNAEQRDYLLNRLQELKGDE